MASNPFHDLYLSEAISEDQLVELFSPVIVKHSGVVFESGNVIVRGLQGTGKTMLLNLLRPDSRLAYRRAGVSFPVPLRAARFVGAGINLRKCGVLEFAQHLDKGMGKKEVQELALLFADFVNYWVVADLLATVTRLLASQDQALLQEIGLNGSPDQLRIFGETICRDPCWFGAFQEVRNFEELVRALELRITTYRRFLNLNIDKPPQHIVETKTVIGDPILKCVEALRASGVLSEATKVFVRIDQYEQLDTLNIVETNYGSSCKELIHKALAARDARVSYRIGTRTHGWEERPAIYRTTDVLERKRDYDILDVDDLFRRRENSRTWLFPEFAEDIFARRMKVSEYTKLGRSLDLSIGAILGKSLLPINKAMSYVSTDSGRREVIRRAVMALPPQVPAAWRTYITESASKDFLAAWLAGAWVRQKVTPRRGVTPLEDVPPQDGLPWDGKPYWYKERVSLALMQIASANRQALLWSGADDVMSLGGGQILVFLFLVQHIWDAWLRDSRGSNGEEFKFPIRFEVQTQGVLEASIEWRQKQAEGVNAQQRKTFIDALGEHFYVALTEDKAMSYPGANGFSLENNELDRHPDIKKFLQEAAGFGDLYESPHTSKKKGERRTKYYLAPILSPYFRIPSVHTKEPEYTGVAQVRRWMALVPDPEPALPMPQQHDLWEQDSE
jgi:hypothetical protein